MPALFVFGLLCSCWACFVHVGPALFTFGLLCSYSACFSGSWLTQVGHSCSNLHSPYSVGKWIFCLCGWLYANSVSILAAQCVVYLFSFQCCPRYVLLAGSTIYVTRLHCGWLTQAAFGSFNLYSADLSSHIGLSYIVPSQFVHSS